MQNTIDKNDEKEKNWWTENKIGPFTYDFLRSCAVGSLMIGFAIILSITLSQVNFVFDILGSTAGVAIAFFIPALMFWRIKRNPKLFVNTSRPCYAKSPEGIIEHDQLTKKILKPEVGCSSWIILAWFIFACGIIFGLLSLTMAIIFDTSLGDKVNW